MTLAKKYRNQGRVLIISPEDTCGVDTLTRDQYALNRLYEKGYIDAKQIMNFLNEKKHV